MTLWGGRFEQETSAEFKAFNDSLQTDRRMVAEDITGSLVWAQALHRAGVLTDREHLDIATALEDILHGVKNGKCRIEAGSAEDIHSWVEARLIERTGDTGKKLHTGRSRNDQVVTGLKLFIRKQAPELRACLSALQHALCELAQQHTETVMPGYTHLQQAQPVVFAHWALAYTEMLERDKKRLNHALELSDECPLGSGALAGSSWPVDRRFIAGELGFSAPSGNSLDAVSDRDYVVDLLYTASVSMIHLSRMAEDMIFFNSDQTGFVSFSDAVTSGSSLMPQKKNPDAWELVRGKTGRMCGLLNAMLMTLKGLPLSYNKDLQEDKTTLFEALDLWCSCLKISTLCITKTQVNTTATRNAVENSYCNATELADALVAGGIPFREAHEITGRCVLFAIKEQKLLHELTPEQWEALLPRNVSCPDEVLHWSRALATKNVHGGTAVNQVAAALSRWQARLQDEGLNVRPATEPDVPAIAKLVNYWARAGENLPRSAREIQQKLQDFLVIHSREGQITGCGSLYIYDDKLVEIRSLGIAPALHGKGGGRRLVEALVHRARRLGLHKVFVLTRAPGFFRKQGFVQVSRETLPEKVMKDCQFCPRVSHCDEVAMVRYTNGDQITRMTEEAAPSAIRSPARPAVPAGRPEVQPVPVTLMQA